MINVRTTKKEIKNKEYYKDFNLFFKAFFVFAFEKLKRKSVRKKYQINFCMIALISM